MTKLKKIVLILGMIVPTLGMAQTPTYPSPTMPYPPSGSTMVPITSCNTVCGPFSCSTVCN